MQNNEIKTMLESKLKVYWFK